MEKRDLIRHHREELLSTLIHTHTCYQAFIYIHWSVSRTLNKLGNTHAHKEAIDRKTTLILHYPPSIHLTHPYTRSPGCETSDPTTHTALITTAPRHALFIFPFLFIFFFISHTALSSLLPTLTVFHLEKIFSEHWMSDLGCDPNWALRSSIES